MNRSLWVVGALCVAIAAADLIGFAQVVSPAVPADAQAPRSQRLAPSAPNSCLSIGVGSNYQWNVRQASANADAAELRAHGVRWLREDLLWSVVQPRRGVWVWDRYDALFSFAARHHMRVLPVLGYGTSWASAPRLAREMPSSTEGRDAFAKFAGRVVARYGPDGTFWRGALASARRSAVTAVEVWNEPWFRTGSQPRPLVTDYVALAAASGYAIHEANPRVTVLANVDDRSGRAADAPTQPWGQAVLSYAADLRGRVDGWAVHPYSWPVGANHAAEAAAAQVERVRSWIKMSDLPGDVWVTELGFTNKAESGQAGAALQYDRFLEFASRMDRPHRVASVFAFTAARPTTATKPRSWDWGYNIIDEAGRTSAALNTFAAYEC